MSTASPLLSLPISMLHTLLSFPPSHQLTQRRRRFRHPMIPPKTSVGADVRDNTPAPAGGDGSRRISMTAPPAASGSRSSEVDDETTPPIRRDEATLRTELHGRAAVLPWGRMHSLARWDCRFPPLCKDASASFRTRRTVVGERPVWVEIEVSLHDVYGIHKSGFWIGHVFRYEYGSQLNIASNIRNPFSRRPRSARVPRPIDRPTIIFEKYRIQD